MTSTKTSPQNITLNYRKFLELRPSRSRRTMWAKYPKNKLVGAVSTVKVENDRLIITKIYRAPKTINTLRRYLQQLECIVIVCKII